MFKRILILILLTVAIVFVFSQINNFDLGRDGTERLISTPKQVLFKFALIGDSENDNVNLSKALDQAKGSSVNFVVGTGDFTKLGELAHLEAAKKVFDDSGLTYYVTSGDRDLWASRNAGVEATGNFEQIFGHNSNLINMEGIQIVILDNSDIYKGIDSENWQRLEEAVKREDKLTFVVAHKTPYHPQSTHVMGADTKDVADQADRLIKLIENGKVDGFFSGDLHFFAEFKSPADIVKITTVGAVGSDRNFLGPRYAVVTVFDDYSWQIEDVAIR